MAEQVVELERRKADSIDYHIGAAYFDGKNNESKERKGEESEEEEREDSVGREGSEVRSTVEENKEGEAIPEQSKHCDYLLSPVTRARLLLVSTITKVDEDDERQEQEEKTGEESVAL